MKTALQNLYQNIIDIPEVMDLPIDLIQKITSEFAKSMDEEKQRIIYAVDYTLQDAKLYESFRSLESGEQYYNDTFNQPLKGI